MRRTETVTLSRVRYCDTVSRRLYFALHEYINTVAADAIVLATAAIDLCQLVASLPKIVSSPLPPKIVSVLPRP